MSCCFLLYYYRDEYNDPLQTLQFYAQQRTSNEKGVTIPSQRRYVEYFGHLLNNQIVYSPKQIVFTGLLITYNQNQIRNCSELAPRSKPSSHFSYGTFLSLGLYYTVSYSNHRRQYQSFEVPLEYDAIVSRDSPDSYSVLNAQHKHFMPPSHQQCRIPLEEDVLIEIFLIKARRAKPVCNLLSTSFSQNAGLLRRNCVISGLTRSFSSIHRCKTCSLCTRRSIRRAT